MSGSDSIFVFVDFFKILELSNRTASWPTLPSLSTPFTRKLPSLFSTSLLHRPYGIHGYMYRGERSYWGKLWRAVYRNVCAFVQCLRYQTKCQFFLGQNNNAVFSKFERRSAFLSNTLRTIRFLLDC